VRRPLRPPGPVAAAAVAVLAAIGLGATAPRAAGPLASFVVGRGEPTIVLLHALGVDHTDWDPVIARLKGRHRVVALDLPGHGASPALNKPSVAEVARLLDGALERLGVKRAILVGHSYSGLVVLEEAAAHPNRAAGVVLVDCYLHTPVDSERLAEMDDLLTRRYPIFVQAVFGLMSVDSTRAERLAARAATVPQAVLTAFFRDAWREDLRARAAAVRAPMLLVATTGIWAEGEPWETARGRLGYEKAPRLRALRILRSGHFVTLDKPDSLARAIARFAASPYR
jgi:pimeloyl-ACP methyl ester carboxylesterase